MEKGHVAFWGAHSGNASALSTMSFYKAKEILPTKLTAADSNRASSYTGLGISAAITLIVLRLPPATLVRNPSQGMSNWVTVIRMVKEPHLQTHRVRPQNYHGMSFCFVQVL